MPASEVANAVLFSNLCDLFESLHKRKRQKPEQDKILNTFINNFRIKVAVSGNKNSTLFPVIRLLLPDKERERAPYNLKEKKLGELLVNVLSLSKQSSDAQKLLNFRSVQNSQDSDFAGVAYFVLKNRVGKNDGKLTVGEINGVLDKIATAEVGNKGHLRLYVLAILDEAFSYALKNLSAEQMKWLLRIILKDLKLGMGVHRTLAAFHPDAPDLFDTCQNLSKVCEDLDDGNTRPLELGMKVFFAVSPMLSERLDVRDVEKLPKGKIYQIENKFDGERFQVHMENGVFEYFSRKGFAYSSEYGKTYDSGLLTPLLKDLFSLSVNSFVLDGEMMGWHKQRQYFGSKGMAFDVKKVKETSTFRPCYCVFDVLYYNGKSLVGPPENGGLALRKRLEILKTMFTDVPGVIMHSEVKIVNESSDILAALNKAMEDQEEGIVVKDTESYYIANKRNAGWYKIKPEYTEDTMSDLDLVIIGAEEAENKKQGRARSFHIACADVVNPGDYPHRWIDVGKVATGLTFEERERVCAQLEKHWTPWKRAQPPASLVFDKEKPDYWIKPEHSIVLQVRASELIRSTDFATDYTLRFPRIVAVRDDKPVKDTMTLQQFNQLAAEKLPVIKLSNKRINQDQIDVETKTRKKRTAKELKVAEQFRTKPTGEVEVTSQALAGRKVYIVSDDEDCKKQELVRIVESHGGKHVENVGPDIWCCVVGRMTGRAKSLIQSQEQDVITTAWLRSLPDSETPCHLSPLDMLSVKKTTKMKWSTDYDRFGDSYKEEIDEVTLRRILEKMEVEEPEIYLTHEEMLNMDKELFGDHNPFSYLRPCFIHFPTKNTLLEIKAKFYGATVVDIDSPKLTHVVLISKDTNIVEMKTKIKNFDAVMVSDDWLKDCFAKERLTSETGFIPKEWFAK